MKDKPHLMLQGMPQGIAKNYADSPREWRNRKNITHFMLALVFLILSGFGSQVFSQTLNAKYVSKRSSKYGIKSFSYLQQTPDVSGKLLLLLTPSFPITFSRIEKDTADNWRVGPQASLGGSYFLVFGNGYKNANGTVQVEPYVVLGVNFEIGCSQNLEEPGAVGNINLGLVVGLYKYFNFLVSYDFVSEKPVFGVGARVDLFAITQGSGTTILNKAKFFAE